ncbi:MAG: type IV pilus twitching motility protein PilT [Candidatus Aminicenantes bacterium]|nr:type IV pilus twitching motility protein PilT [Candidatus Aminicenantes bacterium]
MDINQLLKLAIENSASDLHLKAGNFPMLRVHGILKPITQFKKLTSADTRSYAEAITNNHQKQMLKDNLDVDLAYSVRGLGRFRGSIYYQRGTLAVVLRIIPLILHNIQDLLLPKVLEKIALEPRGLVLVTGTTGSGKSTSLAAMINHINKNRSVNIITIEDPIEFLHQDDMSTINQREVDTDVLSFARGLRASLREDPDVILVGEMRDRETIETAILAAETGHLVLSTLHTLDAPETINRIVTSFPPHNQNQVRLQLSFILKAVISMRLIQRKDNKGRVPAVEVMLNTPFISECIQKKEKIGEIINAISSGVSEYGMQTFDQSLYYLYSKGYITFEQGMQYSTSPNDFKLRVLGIRSSGDIARDEMENSMGEIEQKLPSDKEDEKE